MEGPFDGALMAGDASALARVESHQRVQRLPETEPGSVYRRARRGAGGRAHAGKVTGGRRGCLSSARTRTTRRCTTCCPRRVSQYHIRLLGAVTEDDLKQYRSLVIPETTALSPVDEEMLGRFKSGGGKVLEAKDGAPGATRHSEHWGADQGRTVARSGRRAARAGRADQRRRW